MPVFFSYGQVDEAAPGEERSDQESGFTGTIYPRV